ncbi:2-polyprenyl-3-methyl-5-hydroxy-6-metoxy-1,4-benzoquinol methylase [Streptomyces sp. DvalAA-14]|uniref:class I SAM-dependent methyltransferase n=1 Tax=unclassified Streptomyces TaxID=2593676 RepID=UPI00081AFD3E|nr:MULTISPECIES: class I SAM-dependent methyltransferase [unclassified Streptomyces]MYS24670.1 methyltransferase domain-containing protein [Streptomyces sp. SID4948]SCE48269.1 2-polyprenyl-3-methyl-5-hydroxy-6-metoxy-1,4-benzoquinol methylase [Streptomyces sp. DvalAA-14]
MSNLELAPEVARFYSETIDESERLSTAADGRLELIRTQELLRRYLPPAPAKILDVGGGPGTHARWLVADGYEVDLVDPIARHVEQASSICRASIGDARYLQAADGSYDVVLLLGPLYHLPDPADRRQALAEARRVVRPGGLVAAAAINRYASLFEHAALAHMHTERMQASVSEILRTAVYDGRRGFTLAYFHRAAELVAELTESGLQHVTVFGIEGPAWSQLKAVEQREGHYPGDALFESVLAAARLAEPHPELLSASSHLLAIGTELPTPR